jgi:hypothetical protein
MQGCRDAEIATAIHLVNHLESDPLSHRGKDSNSRNTNNT